MPRTTKCESSTWRELPASRAPALSASRSGRASSGQPQQVVRADEQRRDPLDAVGRGSPLARGGTSATHWRESPASAANGAFVLSASRSGRGSSGQPQQGVRADEEGEIPWVRVGRVRRVPVEALRQLIRTRVVDRRDTAPGRDRLARLVTGVRTRAAGFDDVCSPPRTRRAKPHRGGAGVRTRHDTGCRDGRQELGMPSAARSAGASEKYLVAYRVAASRRARSRGTERVERITAKRPQEEIGRCQRVVDAVKAALRGERTDDGWPAWTSAGRTASAVERRQARSTRRRRLVAAPSEEWGECSDDAVRAVSAARRTESSASVGTRVAQRGRPDGSAAVSRPGRSSR